MGNDNSKDNTSEVKQLGDQQVTLIENQQIHTEFHTQHDFKLWIIIVLLTILLIERATRIIYKRCKKQAKQAFLQTV